MKYESMIKSIIDNIGGKDNVNNVTHCYTRLRFVWKDSNKANKEN